jgi:dynein light chain LC8-type
MEAKKQEAKKTEKKKKEDGMVVVKVKKMPDNMANLATQLTLEGLEKFDDLHKSADYVKSEFEADKFVDEETGEKISTKGVWHCVIGRKFGSYVTFAEGNYIMFYVGQLCVLLFKS